MPYSASDVSSLPPNVQKLSPKRRRQWVAVWTSARSRALTAGKSVEDAEASAFAQANGVIKEAVASYSNGTAHFEWAAPGTPPPPLFVDEATGTVYREGPIFEPGDYPDKAYGMTPEEIRAAAEAFDQPQPIDLEHLRTVLDPEGTGRLGQVVALDASDDGTELRGLVALPKWLDDQIGAGARKVSASWNRATKQLEGLALVLSPRIERAALMAAFSQAQQGESAMSPNPNPPPAPTPPPTTGEPVGFAEWDTAYQNSLPNAAFLWVEPGSGTRYLPVRNAQGDLDLPHLRNAISRLGHDDTGRGTSMPKAALLKKAQGLLERATASDDAAVLNVDQLRQVAEFAAVRHDTPEGRGQLQMVHDVAARGGAVCNTPASMASQHEADALQQIHNLATQHGAVCADASGGGTVRATPPYFSTPTKEGRSLMSGIRERLGAFFARLDENQLAELLPPEVTSQGAAATGAPTTTPTPPATPAPVTSMTQANMAAGTRLVTGESETERRLLAQVAAVEAENRRIRAERIQEQAATFADHFIRTTHQAFPVQRDSIVQAYVQMATLDLLLPGSATFADGKPTTNVAILKAVLDAAPPNQLTAEQLAPGIFAALANQDQTTKDASFATAETPLSLEQVRLLIRRTSLGQSALDYADRGGMATNGHARTTN